MSTSYIFSVGILWLACRLFTPLQCGYFLVDSLISDIYINMKPIQTLSGFSLKRKGRSHYISHVWEVICKVGMLLSFVTHDSELWTPTVHCHPLKL